MVLRIQELSSNLAFDSILTNIQSGHDSYAALLKRPN